MADDFDAHFREQVVPDLRRAISRFANEMADDKIGYTAASAELMHMAHQRGAGRLSDVSHGKLEEWVGRKLLDEVLSVEDTRALVRGLLREPSRAALRTAVREFVSGGAGEQAQRDAARLQPRARNQDTDRDMARRSVQPVQSQVLKP